MRAAIREHGSYAICYMLPSLLKANPRMRTDLSGATLSANETLKACVTLKRTGQLLARLRDSF
ncbi:hypothetical protein DPMN_163842 [Dreissena polymorpha]|uniref:Uncharacterized protein n=1 Tax=Dreissena polymorpha TaxID=45954 RepID=A0A9D4IUT5_DREPO|nr:hypothetical protein DPMN_163842 [Dreissena polymorpha]